MSIELEWKHLESLTPDKNKLAYERVKGNFRKVAWDVYKPLSGEDSLWELREEDGEKFLVALYGDNDDMVVESEKESEWTAKSDFSGENVTLAWKNVPVHRFSGVEYKFRPSEANGFASFIEKKASNQDFISGILNIMPDVKREAVKKLINHREA